MYRQRKSAWQEAAGRETFVVDEGSRIAWGKMWLAVHPDHRTNTLVILGGRNILLIHDYKVMLRAWEKLAPGETPGEACSPAVFADVFQGHDEISEDETAEDFKELEIDEIMGLLAVADGRAFCVYSAVSFKDPPQRLKFFPYNLWLMLASSGRHRPHRLGSWPSTNFRASV